MKFIVQIKVENRIVQVYQDRHSLQEVMQDLARAIFGSKEQRATPAPQTVDQLAGIIKKAGGSVR